MDPLRIALIVLALVGVWALVELALMLKRARATVESLDRTVSDVNDVVGEARPVIVKLDAALDAVAPALEQIDPLLKQGTVAVEALSADLLADVPSAAAKCRDCLARLDEGTPLAQAMSQSGVLPRAQCRLLELGLRSGSGDSAMEQIARQLSEESEMALEETVGRVEPTLVVITSVLVGLILLSVMLPLMHIMTAIG